MNSDLSLENYIDIKKIEGQLNSRKEELNQKNERLLEPLYKFGEEYPNLAGESLLPKDLSSLDASEVELRFNIIKNNINRSGISDEEKESLTELIEQSLKSLKYNLNGIRLTNRSLDKVREAKQKRLQHLEEKFNEGSDLVEQVNKINKRIKHLEKRREELRAEGLEKGIDLSIGYQIRDYRVESKELQTKAREILAEIGEEEFVEYKKDILGIMPASQTKEEVIDEFVHPAEPEPVETEEIVGVEAPRVFNLGGNEEGLLPDDMDDVVKTFNPEEEVHEVIDDLDVPSVSEQKVPTADEELNVDEFFERLATHKRNGAIPRVDGVIELPPAPEPEVVGPDDGLDELIEEVKGYKLTEPISGLDEVDFQSVSGPAVDEPVVSEKGLVVVPPAPTAEPTPEENGILSNESIYPMRLSNDVSMYKKKSELEGISDDLVGKWVVKNKDGKYVDIDKATDFEPEQAILVLPDNAIIDEKTGSYSIPDDSELPKNYQENEFKKERKEEQLEVVDSHKNWFLEQKIKLQKNLRVVLGVVSLAAATSAIALGTGGLSVAVPVGAMAFNLIDGITNTPERLAVSDAKQLYKEAKKLVNNHSDEIGETTTKNIVNQAKKIQEMKERIKANKKNGSLQMSEIEALEKMNQALADHLDQVYGYSEEEPKGRRR